MRHRAFKIVREGSLRKCLSLGVALSLASILPVGSLAASDDVTTRSCTEWIEIRPKGNWQNPEKNTPEFEQSSADCIRDLGQADNEERIALLDRYLLSALNIINPDDVRKASAGWSETAKLKVNAIRVPFILSPFVPDSEDIGQWLEEARRTGDNHSRSRFAYYYGYYRAYASEEELSDEEFDALLQETIEASKEAGGMRIGLFAQRQQAITAKQAGDLSNAVRLLTEVVDQSTAPRLDLVHVNALADLAYLFYEVGDQDRAVALFDRAIASTDRHPLTIGQVYLNRALALEGRGNLEQAAQSAAEAIKRFEDHTKNNSSEGAALPGLYNARFELARIRYRQGRTDPANILSTARDAADQLYETDYFTESVHAEAYAWLAQAYLEQGQASQATAMLQKAEEAFGKPINPDDIAPVDQDRAFMLPYLRSMATMLRQLGDYQESSKYAAAALELSEQRFEREKLRAVGNADLIFSLEEQEERAQLLARTAELATLERDRNFTFAVLGALLALATLIAAFALYRAYRAQRHVAETKDTFLSEMHHRLANNLQTLLSLFRIEARREKRGANHETSGARSEAVLRLKTMALLHKKLRAREGRTAISARAFFSDLRQLLEDTMGSDKIALNGTFDDVLLETDIAVPLGLLTNELVTNSFKHGFADGPGTVEIKFKAGDHHADLIVADDGVGVDTAGNNSSGFGMGLIEDLALQTGGMAKRSTPASGSGTIWTVTGVPLAQ